MCDLHCFCDARIFFFFNLNIVSECLPNNKTDSLIFLHIYIFQCTMLTIACIQLESFQTQKGTVPSTGVNCTVMLGGSLLCLFVCLYLPFPL